MPMPFQKEADAGVAQTPVMHRDGGDYGAMDAVVDDIMKAFETGNRELLKQALSSFADIVTHGEAT